MKAKIDIATLLTCHNRKDKTLNAVRSLLVSEESYNSNNDDKVMIDIYLTDDGCTDGTAEAITSITDGHLLKIIKTDGNAYWAGGMRAAWKEAVNKGGYDFYLLINDDAILKDNCLEELLKTDAYCNKNYRKGGVYTGFLASPKNHEKITYGAEVHSKGLLKSTEVLKPTGYPQECIMPNANILLVSNDVVSNIGILSDSYIHGAADWDYGMRARKAGFPVLTTSSICGYCANDHDSRRVEANKVTKMSFKERKAFLNKPTRHYADGFTFYSQYNKVKYIMLKIGYVMNLCCPRLFYYIFVKRNSNRE